MSDLEEPKSGVSRRTVAKAMAWSVPAIALAVPAPAYAVSPCEPVVTLSDDSCKCPGASTDSVKAYFLQFEVSGTTCPGVEGTVTIHEVNFTTGGGGPFVPLGEDPFPLVIPIGGTSPVIGFDGSGNSAHFIEVCYQVNDGPIQCDPKVVADLDNCTEATGYCNSLPA